MRSRTLGGKQYWADELVFHEWRIQRNVFTGHSRLLDGADRRHAWGTFDACHAKLEEIRRRDNLPPMRPCVVILLHGLFRARGSMDKLARSLRENSDWTVVSVGYPSTQGTLADHTRTLNQVIGRFEGVEEINFVSHSLGALVIRRWLHDFPQATSQNANQATNQNATQKPRLGRIVMLAPPNHQPKLAEWFVPLDFTGQVAGESGKQLAYDWKTLEPTLATPLCPFGILAGGNQKNGNNPLISGDDDLVVTVESTKLAGAADFRVLPVRHTFMMNDSTLQTMTRTFLQHGYFESPDTRAPLPKE